MPKTAPTVRSRPPVSEIVYACPFCDALPWTTGPELAEHLAEHGNVVEAPRPFTPAERASLDAPLPPLPSNGRFETVPNGFGGTTSRRIEPKPERSNGPTEKQTAFLRSLLAERAGADTAEAIRAVLNTARNDGKLSKAVVSHAIERLLAMPKAAKAPTFYPPTPIAGHYAISSTGDNDLAFYKVDRPTTGNWAGHVFVKLVVGGHPDRNVPRSNVTGVLARIDADPDAAARYGRELGRCHRCNRTLTDETSRALGIGPECRSK